MRADVLRRSDRSSESKSIAGRAPVEPDAHAPIVEIAVIESQHDRIFLQRLSRQIGGQLRAADRFVTGALPVTGPPAGGGMSLTADAAQM